MKKQYFPCFAAHYGPKTKKYFEQLSLGVSWYNCIQNMPIIFVYNEAKVFSLFYKIEMTDNGIIYLLIRYDFFCLFVNFNVKECVSFTEQDFPEKFVYSAIWWFKFVKVW